MYLARPEVQNMNQDAAAKLARIHFAKRRHERNFSDDSIHRGQERYDRPLPSVPAVPPPANFAVELPAGDVAASSYAYGSGQRPQYKHTASIADMKYTVISSDEYPQAIDSAVGTQTTQLPYRPSMEGAKRSNGSLPTSSPRQSTDHAYQIPHQTSPQGAPRSSPPPLPPKTPLPYPEENSPRTFTNMGSLNRAANSGLPYPESDAPPPVVNVARKPEFGAR